ncbi:beta-N-acetylhexosaminidase [Paenibacillus sp. UNC451MF]|uniref:beta-N-acetylhexosaminidase n=1 Tax=Paenibacillus sp. UNC451MF TaxID=1449063 RepID=UPI0009DF3A04|nr:beta-N-acetylhexosaminidase [Paenibacillus sp. UNC451MF]
MRGSFLHILLSCTIAFSPLALSGCTTGSQQGNSAAPSPSSAPKPTAAPDPIRELVDSMTIEEKIGQMVLFGVDGTVLDDTIRKHITKDHVGGFIFFGPNIKDSHQAWSLFNSMQQENVSGKLPLFLSVDQEGGRVSRMPKEIPAFPTSQSVGKTKDPAYAYKVGSALGHTLGAFGLNVDFAPVLDVNSNPNNPVIGDRSFGATAETVSSMGIQEMKGIQSTGIISVVKHFPGHGDTSVDSHKDLPVVQHDLERLRTVEFAPFAEAIRQGADAVMVAHLLVTKLDPQLPASISPVIIQKYLRGEMGFQGVVITDDMTMEAIGKTMPIDKAAVQAIQAGADIVLVGHEAEKEQAVLNALLQAAKSGTITKETIDASVYRIAKLKNKAKLSMEGVAEPNIAKLGSDIKSALSREVKK